jgi:hypothetical protein
MASKVSGISPEKLSIVLFVPVILSMGYPLLLVSILSADRQAVSEFLTGSFPFL